MSKTALVTGASAGIGLELARLFVRDGHNAVLVARSKERLQALAAELCPGQSPKAHVIAVDLGSPDAADTICRELDERGLAVDFLVNNAGFGSNGAFLDLPLGKELEMVQVNVSSLLALTHKLAGPMRARGFGRVLNIASTAGFQGGPYMATYYATKAFVITLSEALAAELRGTGVSVTCHCPGATATEFAGRAGNDKSPLFQRNSVAKASDVARDAYDAMMRGEVLRVHGAMNAVGVFGTRLIPRGMAVSIAGKLNKVS
jgi:hypothetical protein